MYLYDQQWSIGLAFFADPDTPAFSVTIIYLCVLTLKLSDSLHNFVPSFPMKKDTLIDSSSDSWYILLDKSVCSSPGLINS